MTDGQIVAVDLGAGIGRKLRVRDLGNGKYAADDVVTNKTLSINPVNGAIAWSDDRAGVWQQFTVSGNILCFADLFVDGTRDSGVARLFGFVAL